MSFNMLLIWAALQLMALPICRAIAIPNPTSGAYKDHPHDINPPLPGLWYHTEDHPVNSLFRRGPNDGVTYAPVGSPSASLHCCILSRFHIRFSLVKSISPVLSKPKRVTC